MINTLQTKWSSCCRWRSWTCSVHHWLNIQDHLPCTASQSGWSSTQTPSGWAGGWWSSRQIPLAPWSSWPEECSRCTWWSGLCSSSPWTGGRRMRHQCRRRNSSTWQLCGGTSEERWGFVFLGQWMLCQTIPSPVKEEQKLTIYELTINLRS